MLLSADSDHCAVCGALFTDKIYVIKDEITGEKVQVCSDCTFKRERCFFCGLPVKTDDTKLPDGRSICARDARTAVLDDATAQQITDGLQAAVAEFVAGAEPSDDLTILTVRWVG